MRFRSERTNPAIVEMASCRTSDPRRQHRSGTRTRWLHRPRTRPCPRAACATGKRGGGAPKTKNAPPKLLAIRKRTISGFRYSNWNGFQLPGRPGCARHDSRPLGRIREEGKSQVLPRNRAARLGTKILEYSRPAQYDGHAFWSGFCDQSGALSLQGQYAKTDSISAQAGGSRRGCPWRKQNWRRPVALEDIVASHARTAPLCERLMQL